MFFSDGNGDLVKRELGENRHVVDPDAFFALRGSTNGRLVGRYYFVEADRATMDSGRMLRKFRDYFLLWKFGLHTDYRGISRFRVLTVTSTRARAANLCEVARGADDHGTGSRLFLFASEQDFTLEDPKALAGAAVISPGEPGPVPLW